MALDALGWDDGFAAAFTPFAADGCAPARVVLEHQHIYRVSDDEHEPLAHVSGRFRHMALARADYPSVGDWVAVKQASDPRRAVIHGVLPRRSWFSRKVAGETTVEQVVAANVDTVFLVAGLDRDFSLRRLERYLLTAREGRATPVIVLNKSDLIAAVEEPLEEVRRIAPDVPVHAISCEHQRGLDALAPYLLAGRTVALLGSSGVGKSTLINRLIGHDRQRTRDVRANDSRGRHTTTHRELVRLPGGALLIDTPGMRELQLWDTGATFDDTFDDVRALARGCHFRDCRHDTEPRCAVRAAVAAGLLPAPRLDSYVRLQREAAVLVRRQDELADAEQRRRERSVHKAMRHFKPRE